MSKSRYRVEPTRSGFWGFQVLGGDSTNPLFVGHKKSCELVARRLEVAWLDGQYFYKQQALKNLPPPKGWIDPAGEWVGGSHDLVFNECLELSERAIRHDEWNR